MRSMADNLIDAGEALYFIMPPLLRNNYLFAQHVQPNGLLDPERRLALHNTLQSIIRMLLPMIERGVEGVPEAAAQLTGEPAYKDLNEARIGIATHFDAILTRNPALQILLTARTDQTGQAAAPADDLPKYDEGQVLAMLPSLIESTDLSEAAWSRVLAGAAFMAAKGDTEKARRILNAALQDLD